MPRSSQTTLALPLIEGVGELNLAEPPSSSNAPSTAANWRTPSTCGWRWISCPLYWHLTVVRGTADEAYLRRLTTAVIVGIAVTWDTE
jgi:hypothetical protein